MCLNISRTRTLRFRHSPATENEKTFESIRSFSNRRTVGGIAMFYRLLLGGGLVVLGLVATPALPHLFSYSCEIQTRTRRYTSLRFFFLDKRLKVWTMCLRLRVRFQRSRDFSTRFRGFRTSEKITEALRRSETRTKGLCSEIG